MTESYSTMERTMLGFYSSLSECSGRSMIPWEIRKTKPRSSRALLYMDLLCLSERIDNELGLILGLVLHQMVYAVRICVWLCEDGRKR